MRRVEYDMAWRYLRMVGDADSAALYSSVLMLRRGITVADMERWHLQTQKYEAQRGRGTNEYSC